ncbi:hemolysin family protein [Anaerolinea thermophila]|uniref:Hypothetical membrane protein n=1 Tax=Anaerolinea thermophila (strain DSM 14523 / JCM 11388 / NBRC 100420 / UNI-1) TaxID=926569 RepID=E8MYK7_ANATU|nr:hemolysin family protein [Anaerolinea thermophila]BAJ64343.1 hypothetical membrane protein [Anaerolinea thermophila UNI-1]
MIFWNILLLLFLILLNGALAMAEIAVISSRQIRLQQRVEDGDKRAETALELMRSPSHFLSTVQIGITLIGILAGAVGGAQLATPLAEWIGQISWLYPYRQELALALVVLVITYLSLVLGELLPKRAAQLNPEEIAVRVAPWMKWLGKVTNPLVVLLGASTDFLLKLLGWQKVLSPDLTEEEIKGIIEQGVESGIIEQRETDMIEGVLRLGDRLVSAFMTPRTEIEWLDVEDPWEVNREYIISSSHNYFPVARGDLDNVLGIINAKELLAVATPQPVDLKDYLKPALFLPESTTALKALEALRTASGNLALILDEYGGLQGMITLFDLMEAIVGEIPSYGEETGQAIIRREDGSLLVDGSLSVDVFKQLLQVEELPEEERIGYQTVAGFVLAQMGTIPSVGQHFEWNRYRFEVVDRDGLRIDKILVKPV